MQLIKQSRKQRQLIKEQSRKNKKKSLLKICICLGLFLGLFVFSNYIIGQAVSLLHFDQKQVVHSNVVSVEEPPYVDTEIMTEDDKNKDKEDKEDKNNNNQHHQQTVDGANKTVYLTFDDGPSKNVTLQIIEVLDKYDVKGTFFVLGNLAEKNPEIIKELDSKGHLVANHSYSHNYEYLYADPNNLLGELEKTQEIIEGILDKQMPRIMRFPGGSFGAKLSPFRKSVVESGYSYFDWNVINGDAEGKKRTTPELVQRVKETNHNYNQAIVLMHDSSTKQTTVDALAEIIEYFLEEGYTFDTLDNYS